MIGKSPFAFIHPEDHAIVKDALWQVQEREESRNPYGVQGKEGKRGLYIR